MLFNLKSFPFSFYRETGALHDTDMLAKPETGLVSSQAHAPIWSTAEMNGFWKNVQWKILFICYFLSWMLYTKLRLAIYITWPSLTAVTTVKLYSENEIFHWLLNNSSNNNWHFLTKWYFMFVNWWSVFGLRFELLLKIVSEKSKNIAFIHSPAISRVYRWKRNLPAAIFDSVKFSVTQFFQWPNCQFAIDVILKVILTLCLYCRLFIRSKIWISAQVFDADNIKS